jgi:alkanesulfonate monooxygenase SsuD/methylene tetrahydromethanopterin reductase-like flavin-dependent oxidoreductase (luciferase family)
MLTPDGSCRTTVQAGHYRAVEAPSTPGTVQDPLPLTVAAGGPKGFRLAATYGRRWVTIGPTGRAPRTAATTLDAVRRQVDGLEAACRAAGRDPHSLERVLLWTPTEPSIDSADQFDELSTPYRALGFDEVVIHHPAQTGPYGGSVAAFEEIAARHAG